MMIGQWVRAAILLLSFCGLCEWVRNRFELNRFIAPYVAASGIILVMMAAGMLRVLKYGAWFLYIAGWSYWIWNLLTKRRRPDWVLMGAAVIFAAYLGWHLGPCKSWTPDDFSHWALAVDSLVRRDAFPDINEPLITFQSYPMGATSFIYYVVRFVGDFEGLRFVAQNFLCGVLLLTVFAHVRGRKRVMIPVVGLIVCFMYKFNRYFQNLQVDWLLSYYGIAIAAAALYERENLKKVLLVTIPGVAAVAFVKSTGLFFAVAGVAALLFAAKEEGRANKKLVWAVGLTACVSIVAFLLWTLHAKISYPAMLDSKHAVSLSAYMEEASSKTLRLCVGTAVRMALRWILPKYGEVFTVLFALGCFVMVRMLRNDYPEIAKRLGRYLIGCAGVFLLWLVMLYAMYIFSMPAAETRKLATYDRYMSSGLLLAVGMAVTEIIGCFSDEQVQLSKTLKRFASIALAVFIVTAPLANNWKDYLETFGRYRLGYYWIREEVVEARDQFDLELGKSYLAYFEENEEARRTCYIMKRDLESADVGVLTRKEDGFLYTRWEGVWDVEDPVEWMKGEIGNFDGILMIDEFPELEAVLGDKAIPAYEID